MFTPAFVPKPFWRFAKSIRAESTNCSCQSLYMYSAPADIGDGMACAMVSLAPYSRANCAPHISVSQLLALRSSAQTKSRISSFNLSCGLVRQERRLVLQELATLIDDSRIWRKWFGAGPYDDVQLHGHPMERIADMASRSFDVPTPSHRSLLRRHPNLHPLRELA